MKKPVLLAVAADRREFGGLTGMRERFVPCRIGLRWSAFGRLNGRLTLLTAHGPGRANARHAVSVASREFDVRAVLSTGVAGALDPNFRVGDALIVNRVVQFQDLVEYPVSLPEGLAAATAKAGRLLTVDEVIQDAEAKARLRSLPAHAVDMEASAVAAEAARRGAPFYCVRVISDAAERSFLVDFNRARRADGTFSGWRIAAQAGLSVQRWKDLTLLRRDAEKAFQELGRVMEQCRFPS